MVCGAVKVTVVESRPTPAFTSSAVKLTAWATLSLTENVAAPDGEVVDSFGVGVLPSPATVALSAEGERLTVWPASRFPAVSSTVTVTVEDWPTPTDVGVATTVDLALDAGPTTKSIG